MTDLFSQILTLKQNLMASICAISFSFSSFVFFFYFVLLFA